VTEIKKSCVFHNKTPCFFVFNIKAGRAEAFERRRDCPEATSQHQPSTRNPQNQPMEQTLPLPLFQPNTAVLAKVRQFARTFRPQPFIAAIA